MKMKLEKIKEYLNKLKADDFLETLGPIGRSLGHELPKKDFKTLAEFRSMLVRATPEGRYIRNSASENGFIQGYLAGLREVADAYEVATTAEVDNKEDVDLVRKHGYKSLVLALLQNRHSTAKELSEYLLTEARPVSPEEEAKVLKDHGLEVVQGMLAMLCHGQLAECLGQSPLVYRLTLHGETVAHILKLENNLNDMTSQKGENHV